MSRRKANAFRQLEVNNEIFFENSNTIDFLTAKSNRNRRPIVLSSKSTNQAAYIKSLLNPEINIVVASGPAGTGKTYLAMLAALQAYQKGECKRIILTRPAITVEDEQHGFLPGTIHEKMEPWIIPMLDVVREYYSTKEVETMFEEQLIEVAPLAYCRGRTFKNCWIIGDEMQNATPNQIKMLMTRIGENSKMILTGDIEQTDRIHNNGLSDLQQRLSNSPNKHIAQCLFTQTDVKRHPLIPSILELYQ